MKHPLDHDWVPSSSNSWTCKWFGAVLLVGMAATIYAVAVDLSIGAATSAFIVGIVIGMRGEDSSLSC